MSLHCATATGCPPRECSSLALTVIRETRTCRTTHNTIAYTGTHDNNTTRGWFEAAPDGERQRLWNYLGRSPGDSSEAAPAMMRLAWSSPAALAMAPLQDLLNLGAEARMNVPGRTEGNWRWRCAEAMLSPSTFERLCDLTEVSNRLPNAFRRSATKSFANEMR